MKVAKADRAIHPSGDVIFNKTGTRVVYEKSGALFLHDLVTKKISQITNTVAAEFNPQFSKDEKKLFFTSDQM